jgi:hypothetical protein
LQHATDEHAATAATAVSATAATAATAVAAGMRGDEFAQRAKAEYWEVLRCSSLLAFTGTKVQTLTQSSERLCPAHQPARCRLLLLCQYLYFSNRFAYFASAKGQVLTPAAGCAQLTYADVC